jgi:hypothetical protein
MTAINIVFDGPPSHDGAKFVEVETDDGRSIRIGQWEPYPHHEGMWRLRITADDFVNLATAQLPRQEIPEERA